MESKRPVLNRLPSHGGFDAIFFDLDGTLVDTAPDMVAVLMRLQDRHKQPRLPFELARNNVSNGAIGMLRLAFPHADENDLQALLEEYLADYQGSLCIESEVFPPLRDLLTTLDTENRPWGIVTNKPERMTKPLVAQLRLSEKAICTVSGDTLAERKPHPAPLLHAASLAGIAPEQSVYVGDARRDIEAGRAAGMATVAVGFGYITDNDDPLSWGADEFVTDTISLSNLLLKAVNLDIR